MTLLILGVLLWSAAHLFKRVLPDARARMGDAGKGVVALASLAAIVLMVIGYRMADGPVFWGRTPMLAGLNNLLMLAAVYLFAASGMKVGVSRVLRHPMLTGLGVWALAHILVNGDLESIVLFGGLGLWAFVSARMINAAEGDWVKPEPAPIRKEIIAVVASVVTYAVFAGAHLLFGLAVFG